MLNITPSITPSDLRRPTDYKRRFERELHRRQNLERRVEALKLENDALKYRLQQAVAKIERLQARPVYSQAQHKIFIVVAGA